ncbi:MAG: bifunctional [glutamate--ammonia ligase]-adenylyl-L-tyrosine phosphorylase/[glutamate--ammonia-ligase] adenylyltransferase [Mariprofundaceae bacterium]|nr:bifunctional [glutamate--ammonia ligase]-adenylyl-L-tyrosine phosphorylase/[glutamate--ammonia-ligase] adenylyltransferase [Mariprofundaceae bacterium]
MRSDCLQYIPKNQLRDVHRLLEISPLFVSLMRTADKDACQRIFQDKEHAVLPNQSDVWMPALDSSDLTACMMHLRLLKQKAMRHIIWWELGIHGDIQASYQAITDVASGLLQQAVEMAERLLAPRFGRLQGGAFCVIGLGKLGGYELNLGSDVDPLFVWQGDGTTQGGRKSVSANEYYNHFSRMLIKLMAEPTSNGMVWPVDMRLRPGGDGAPICLNLDATLSHYLEYGQTWERAMLIKARPVAGDMALGQQFIQEVCPFIYRRYLDYTCVAALADMKQRIDAQAGQQQLGEGFNVKLGRGGIREIEFIIQAMQLLHAGREPSLRIQHSKKALYALQDKGFISQSVADALFSAYTFWRRIEHALQARKGEQTHLLPADYESYLTQALALPHLAQDMQTHRDFVAHTFKEHILPITTAAKATETVAASNWLNADCLDSAQIHAHKKQPIQAALQHIDQQLSRGLLPERSRQQVESILNIAMPIWLDDTNAVQAVAAFADLLKTISGRATWIDLLATHQGVLQWLIGVLAASRYVSEHISKNPSWLEWPLEHTSGAANIQQLCTKIKGIHADEDAEELLRTLSFILDQGRIHCALSIDAHQEGPVVIGQWLADLADVAVQTCVRSSLSQLHLPADFAFVALALGKHGSQEMGLVSDLDMVFVLAQEPQQVIRGKTAREWAQRLGRRVIRQLTGIPPFGAGYEFDARLRPSGNSGVLVTTLAGFQDYQRHEAQTWEHQALSRARAITGTASVQNKVTSVIHDIIHQPRNFQHTAHDILTMRQKMMDHLASRDKDNINLKHDAGGMVDIEFIAQFSRLMFGGNHVGTVRTLQSLPTHAPAIWHEKAAILEHVYIHYRQMENALRVEQWLSIGCLPNNNNNKEWETMRRHANITSTEQLQYHMRIVHDIFQQLLSSNLGSS